VTDSYVELDGDVGIIGNGAGLTMATIDKLEGGEPADFYDVGRGTMIVLSWSNCSREVTVRYPAAQGIHQR